MAIPRMTGSLQLSFGSARQSLRSSSSPFNIAVNHSNNVFVWFTSFSWYSILSFFFNNVLDTMHTQIIVNSKYLISYVPRCVYGGPYWRLIRNKQVSRHFWTAVNSRISMFLLSDCFPFSLAFNFASFFPFLVSPLATTSHAPINELIADPWARDANACLFAHIDSAPVS